MEQKITFTAFLQDDYSKKFEKLVNTTNKGIEKIRKDLDRLEDTGKAVTRSIEALDKRIQSLSKTKKLSLNTDDIRSANTELKALIREKEKLQATAPAGGGSSWLGGIGKGFAIDGAKLLMKGVTYSMQAAMEREQQRFTLGTLTGSQRVGNALMDNLEAMAGKTPFSTKDLMKSAETMLGYGVDQNKLLPAMQQLGDISGGNVERFQNLTLAFSQMQSAGKLTTQDLQQMVRDGFNPLNEIAKATGQSVGALTKEMENGKVSAEMVMQAMQNATSEGGRYFGLMEMQSQTTQGFLNTLTTEANELGVAVGERLKPSLDGAIGGLSSLVASVRDWVEVPTSEKIMQEAVQLRALKAELTETNTTEDRRKQIVSQLKTMYPDLLKNIDLEKDGYQKLNVKLTDTITLLEKKSKRAFFDSIVKDQQDSVSELFKEQIELGHKLRMKYAKRYPDIFDKEGITDNERMRMVKERIEPGSTEKYGFADMDVRELNYYLLLRSRISDAGIKLKETVEDVNKQMKESGLIDIVVDPAKTTTTQQTIIDTKNNNTPNASASISIPSISGSSSLNHLTINIDSLVKGGINISTATIKESAAQIKDLVAEALLNAVNDTNLG